jgi:hypothetical protein
MNVSENLTIKLERLEKHGYCNDLTFQEKLEIERLINEKINRSCSDCTRRAMFKLMKLLKENEPKPIIHFVGVVEPKPKRKYVRKPKA